MAKKNKTENDDKNDNAGFEDLLAEAETLAARMESGGLSLDESIAAYEKGVDNLRRCADLLKAAEEKVQVLLEKNGSFRLEELDPQDDGNDNGDADSEDEDDY